MQQDRSRSSAARSQYVCCSCGLVLSSPSSFLQHRTKEAARLEGKLEGHQPWAFPCTLCGKTLQEHGLVCCHCGEKFPTNAVLTVHLRTVQTVHLVQCDFCEVALAAAQLKKHMQKDHQDCLLDRRGKVQLSNTSRHSLVELEQFLRPCADCGKFTLKKEKLAHYKAEHSEYYRQLLNHNNEAWKSAPSSQYSPCDICSKSIRKCNMKEHKLNTHSMDINNKRVQLKVKPESICNICGHVSKYAKDLKKHKKSVHEKILDYECNFCGKKFSNRGNLNQHKVIHTGVTPFQCHLCGRQCRRKSELEKHITTHGPLGLLGMAKPEPLEGGEDPLSLKGQVGVEVVVRGQGGRITTITQVCEGGDQ